MRFQSQSQNPSTIAALLHDSHAAHVSQLHNYGKQIPRCSLHTLLSFPLGPFLLSPAPLSSAAVDSFYERGILYLGHAPFAR